MCCLLAQARLVSLDGTVDLAHKDVRDAEAKAAHAHVNDSGHDAEVAQEDKLGQASFQAAVKDKVAQAVERKVQSYAASCKEASPPPPVVLNAKELN